jgi:hypothetical protein
MGFSVVNDAPKTIWMPVAVGATLYVGQLVKCINEGATCIFKGLGSEGATNRVLAAGIDFDGNSSAINNTIFGVVIGTNAKTPVFDATFNTERIAYASPYAAAVGTETYVGAEGPWSRGDNIAMVKVAIITPDTVLRSPLYSSSATFGTAPTVLTVTGSSANGMTHAASGSTNLAGHGTVYFRSGPPAGQYRMCDINNSTCTTWDIPLTLATSGTSYVGATFVHVALRMVGPALCNTATTGATAGGLWIDSAYNCSTDNFGILVHRMDLSNAGQEYVEFSFSPQHLGLTGGIT